MTDKMPAIIIREQAAIAMMVHCDTTSWETLAPAMHSAILAGETDDTRLTMMTDDSDTDAPITGTWKLATQTNWIVRRGTWELV